LHRGSAHIAEAAVARDMNAPGNACGTPKTFLRRPHLQMVSTA
jgi:hypothetical protein